MTNFVKLNLEKSRLFLSNSFSLWLFSHSWFTEHFINDIDRWKAVLTYPFVSDLLLSQ